MKLLPAAATKPTATPGWILIGIALIDWLRRLDFVVNITSSKMAQSLLGFLMTPLGTLLIFGAGLAWLVLLARRQDEPLTSVADRTVDHRVRWLLDLHALGTDMLLARPISYQHLGRLEQDSESWAALVREALRRSGATDVELSRFDRLQEVPVIASPNAISPEHQRVLSFINRRLTILREFAERIGLERE